MFSATFQKILGVEMASAAPRPGHGLQNQRLIFAKHGVDAGKAGMQAKAPAQVQKPVFLARFRQHQRAAQIRKTWFRIGLYRVKPIQPAP